MSSIYNAYIPEDPYETIPEAAPPGSGDFLSKLFERFRPEKLDRGELLVLLILLLLLREGDRSDAALTLGIAALLFLLDGGSVQDGPIRQGEFDLLI